MHELRKIILTLAICSSFILPSMALDISVGTADGLSNAIDTINTSGDVASNTITASVNQLVTGSLNFMGKSVDIIGGSASNLIEINVNNTGSGLSFLSGTDSSVKSLKIINASNTAIYNSANLIVDNVSFEGNYSGAGGYGGAIQNDGGFLTVTSKSGDVLLNGNFVGSGGFGGAIYNQYGDTIITTDGADMIFEGNFGDYGGAIYNWDGNIAITANAGDIVFNGNHSNAVGTAGGAILNDQGSTMAITAKGGNVVFRGNHVADGSWGGAIYNETTVVTTIAAEGGNVIFDGNSAGAGGLGGAIYNYAAELTLTVNGGDIIFINNTADGTANDLSFYYRNIDFGGDNGTIYFGGGIDNLYGGGYGNERIVKTGKSTIVLAKGSVNENYDGIYRQTEGTLTSYTNSFFNGTNDFSDSNLNLWHTGSANTNRLILNNMHVNLANGTINTFSTTNMTSSGINDFHVDIDAKNGISDSFSIGTLSGSGIFNIRGINLIGNATAEYIPLTIFDVTSNGSTVTYETSVDSYSTPTYRYNFASLGSGDFYLQRAGFNKQVFRGQAATLAAYNNQLTVNNALFDHIYLDNNELIAKHRGLENKYVATGALFAPYQYRTDNDSLWFKSYVTLEKLSMTQNLLINNTAYGQIVGADFRAVNLKRGWKFLPTIYIAYNGGRQSFDNITMNQNGGQGGFMGSFMKKDFIGSIIAYGGGYNNEMYSAGFRDRTGNWFAGAAAKSAYNFHPTRHFIVQPNALVSYNIFGKQNWGSDFGAISMNAGYLNGINVAPGLNLIHTRETWSLYFTSMYMFNINDDINGSAGNVSLPNLRMRHGFIEYGFGATKRWKERFMGYYQMVFRNGGRTGVGFQLGLSWMF